MAQRVQAKLGERFAEIDAVAEENTRRVMTAFQDNRVSDACFAGTTGYGYDDFGRDNLERIYARIFGTWPSPFANPFRRSIARLLRSCIGTLFSNHSPCGRAQCRDSRISGRWISNPSRTVWKSAFCACFSSSGRNHTEGIRRRRQRDRPVPLCYGLVKVRSPARTYLFRSAA